MAASGSRKAAPKRKTSSKAKAKTSRKAKAPAKAKAKAPAKRKAASAKTKRKPAAKGKAARSSASSGLRVAVTGPTGDLGISLVSALERARSVKSIVGMARRPFDPAEQGWKKTEYRQGDVQDRQSVEDAVKGADVVVHLAFAILDASDRTRGINIDGSRNVFEAAAEAGAKRVCYASSVAAYGFHEDNPEWLDEGIPSRGTADHFYSQQKAEVEEVLRSVLARRPGVASYSFRPCIVAGPTAQTLLEEIPYFQMSERMPGPVRRLLSNMPVIKPVIPDPGTPFQLVHSDDVASAFMAGVQGKGTPGPYNLAAEGVITASDLAAALGWYSIPIPELTVDAAAELVSRLPMTPERASWIHSLRQPVLMKTDRARKELGWRPKHTARQTLRQTIDAYRREQHVG